VYVYAVYWRDIYDIGIVGFGVCVCVRARVCTCHGAYFFLSVHASDLSAASRA